LQIIQKMVNFQGCGANMDNINPDHYRRGQIQTIDAIEAMVEGWPAATGYRLGNVLKYLWRHADKGGTESLRKARWYLDREIAAREAGEISLLDEERP
jgi:hypothetical protein